MNVLIVGQRPPEVQLLGLAIWEAGPLRKTYLPLDRGMTVLFGLNGAGKSSVLRALRAALEGHRTDGATTALICRVQTGTAWPPLAAALFPGNEEREGWFDLSALVDGWLRTQWVSPRGPYVDRPEHAARLAAECARSLTFALCPVGGGTPLWAAYLVGQPSEDAPLLREEVARVEAGWEEALGLEADAEPQDGAGLEAMIELERSTPLLESHWVGARSTALEREWQPFVVVAAVGELDARSILHSFAEVTGDLDAMTAEALLTACRRAKSPVLDAGRPQLSEPAGQWLSDLERRVQEVYASLLMDAPELQ